MKKVFLLLGAAVLLLVALIVVRTLFFGSARRVAQNTPVVAVPEAAAERLAGSLRFPTISHDDPSEFDAPAFQALHAYLQSAFPRVHLQLRREVVRTHSLLYTWQGSDPSLKPILLMGHLDVVPVEPASEERWSHHPFGGRIVDGVIWGRGAIDDKAAVVGTLESVELLLGEGFRPARTVYLAYGHDEELGGTGGAREIAALLASRGVELEMALDEGGVVSDGILPDISVPVALVGIAEKGFVSIELSTRTTAAHSALPPHQSAIGILGAAIARIEVNPMSSRLDGPTRQLFDRIGPRFPFVRRAVFANLWLTAPLVTRLLEQAPTTNAMVRTTAAPTVFHAGTKENILPSEARAVINFRILPGDSVAMVLDHVRRVINDSRVSAGIVSRFSSEPSGVSNTDSESFRTLEKAIMKAAPDVIVAPYLVVVATDARHYSHLTRNVFRFLPLRLKPEDVERIHGAGECLAVRTYESAIRVYRQILLDFAGR